MLHSIILGSVPTTNLFAVVASYTRHMPHDLWNYLRLRILGIRKSLGKSQNYMKL